MNPQPYILNLNLDPKPGGGAGGESGGVERGRREWKQTEFYNPEKVRPCPGRAD